MQRVVHNTVRVKIDMITQECMWLTDVRAYGKIRELCQAKEPAAQPYAARLRQHGEQFCRDAAPAVTDKQFTRHSPTHDPHDYVSIGTYWWPNPESPDGLPYVSHDGQLSPDFHLYDRPRWDRAADGMISTIKGAYFLDQQQFAQEAAKRVRRWFCDSETCMTPHLRYAQMIPGRCTGASIGLIDIALYLPTLLDHLHLLARLADTPWSNTDQQTMVAWCEHLLAWLESHRFGREEEERTNNHAVYYDRLIVCLALFLNRPERARAQLRKSQQRIAQQIQPDGSMPAELRRTCSFGYTLMNLRGLVDLAWIGRRLDVPLWSDRSEDGQGTIRAAVDLLYRHAYSEALWPYQQIEPIHWPMIWPVLNKASILSDGEYEYRALAHRMAGDFVPDLFPMVEPIHPFGESRSPEGIAQQEHPALQNGTRRRIPFRG